MSNGLVRLTSVGELEEAEKKETASFDTEASTTELARHIRRAWETNRRHKDNITHRLLNCLRARKGVYSDEELRKILDQGGADPVYLKLTGTKCRAASAWVRDVLLPAGDKPWSLSPTPLPELPPAMQQNIMMAAMQQPAAQEDPEAFVGQVREQVEGILEEAGKKAVHEMEEKIEDLQVQGDWHNAFEEFIEDFVTYPAAFIKGPYIKNKKTLKWDSSSNPVVTQEKTTAWRRVSPFDIYTGPFAKNMQEGDLIERLPMTRGTLYNCIGLDGYNEEEIRAVLEEYDHGFIYNWLWEDYEKDYLESNSSYFRSDKDTIDAVHYWGSVKGQLLLDWGVSPKQIPDPLAQYEIDAILIKDRVIRAVINDDPLGQRPYHSASWDTIPSSIWGNALPEQMEDNQRIVNATARALISNMSLAAGPQATVMVDQLAQGEDISEMYPFKVWQMKNNIMTGGQADPVKFFQPAIISGELLTVLNQFEQKADDVTNVPRYTYGSGGAEAQTARGLAMLMNSAAKGIRRAINHIDQNVIKPTIYQTFVHLMLHDPDPSIKGDVKIVPRGSAALLIKEQQQESRKQFLQFTMNDVDMQIVGIEGRTEILKEIAKDLGMDTDKIFSKDPRGEQIQAQMQQVQEELQSQQEEITKGQDQIRQKEMEIFNRLQKVAERELQTDRVAMVEEIRKEQEQLATSRIELEKKMANVSVQEENLKVMQKSISLDREATQLNVDRAKFEHMSGDFERRISDAESDAAVSKLHRIVGDALHKLDLAEKDLEKTYAMSEQEATPEQEMEKEESADQINQIRQEVLTQFAELIGTLNKPKKVVRDEEGRISSIQAD